MRSSAYLILGSLATASAFAACAPSAGEGQGMTGSGASASNGDGTNGGSTSGSNGSAAATGGGASNGSSAGFGNVGTKKGGPSSAGEVTRDASCGGSTLAAESIEDTVEIEVPYEVVTESVFYIMQDESGSMVSDAVQWVNLIGGLFGGGGGSQPNNKWDAAVAAITQFVSDPTVATTELALNYFPGGGQCDGTGYDTPSVPMAPLSTNAQQIIDSLNAQGPNGNTPTEGALRGLTTYCLNYNAQQQALLDQGAIAPEDKKNCVAILVTDGAPTACNTDTQYLAGIAANAAMNGVMTFAVGMDGADFGVLNAIATAGGGDCTPNDGDPSNPACDVSGDPAAFLQALKDIRQSVQQLTRTETRTETQTTTLECEWGIPEPPPDEEFNQDLVNVQFTTGGTEQSIGYVESEADCASVGGGWYYDNPDDPQRIKVCDSTCSVIQGVTDARIDILLGCATEPAIPE